MFISLYNHPVKFKLKPLGWKNNVHPDILPQSIVPNKRPMGHIAQVKNQYFGSKIPHYCPFKELCFLDCTNMDTLYPKMLYVEFGLQYLNKCFWGKSYRCFKNVLSFTDNRWSEKFTSIQLRWAKNSNDGEIKKIEKTPYLVNHQKVIFDRNDDTSSGHLFYSKKKIRRGFFSHHHFSLSLSVVLLKSTTDTWKESWIFIIWLW